MCSDLQRRIILFFTASFILSACSATSSFPTFKKDKPLRVEGTAETIILDADKPKMRAEKQPNPQNLGRITVADAAKVSDTELKAAASKPAAQTTKRLGKTIVSLGLLDEAGFWLQTPLVASETEGRVVNAVSGKSANIRLIPNGAPSGSGSQMSIAAMQLLGIAITDLAEVEVFKR